MRFLSVSNSFVIVQVIVCFHDNLHADCLIVVIFSAPLEVFFDVQSERKIKLHLVFWIELY